MSANILVVDDEAAVRTMLSGWLRDEGYQCDLAAAADEALDVAGRHAAVDVALLDLAMPGDAGIQLVQQLRERQQDMAVIMCAGWQSFDAAVRGMRGGANDYLLKPFSRTELLDAVQRAVRWRAEVRRVQEELATVESAIELRASELAVGLGRLDSLMADRIERWLAEVAPDTPEAAVHASRVARMSVALAAQMDRPPFEVMDIWRGALLHDIGKLAMPRSLLQKPGALTEDEINIIRTHPVVGHRIVSSVDELARAAEMVRSSHEAWDGSGYPSGLVGDAIPVGARIIAVADTYDALTWSRMLREPITTARAAAELVRASGFQFDPAVVRAWLAVLDGSVTARVH